MKPGERVGPYEVLSPLGAGGMGEVWRAHDCRLGRDVAIKVLPESFAADEDRLRRFEHEARATAALNHPGIVAVYDIGTHDGAPYIVTELLEGQTLRTVLLAGPMPASRVVVLAVQLAEALAAAHEKGIVHRDLKPENVIVTPDGRAKILDFGLAKLARSVGPLSPAAEPGRTPAATQVGTVVGTVAYMSPEQARGHAVDNRSDIFSLGLLLYEMLAAHSPFARDTQVDAISALLSADPQPLPEVSDSIGTELDRVVRHCLEKRPEDRFQSARDLAFGLATLARAPTGRVRLGPDPVSLRKWWPRVAVPVALVAAGGAAMLGISRFAAVGRATAPTFTQKTFRTQTISVARFAPDGRTILFSATQQRYEPQLMAIRPEYPDAVPLGFDDTHLLSVSSKGELAVLVRARPRVFRLYTGTLARVPMGGGAPRELLEGVHDADWLPDGSDLAILRDVSGKDRLELPAGKVLYETPGYISDLRVSPTGDRVAFMEHPIRFDDRGVVVIVDRDGRRVTASEPFDGLQGVAWQADGRELLFSGQRGEGINSLVVHGLSQAGRRRVVLGTAGRLTIQDVSRTGQWLVTRDDWRIEMMVRPPGETSERDVSWLDSGMRPMLSGDGRTLFFLDQSDISGPDYTVCMRPTDGSPVVRLGTGSSHDLSADGKSVLAVLHQSPPGLRVFPTAAGEIRTIALPELAAVTNARWLGDDTRVTLCGNQPGQASRCWVRALANGPSRPVTPEGFTDAWPSPDGTRFVAVGTAGYRLFPIAGGEGRPLPGFGPGDAFERWSPDGRTIWVWRRPGLGTVVDSYDLETGQRTRIAQIMPRSYIGVLGVRLSLSDDPNVYVYQTWQVLSHLFVVDGVR
jgi:eukaryotic-like serine/threonine-protein kinase